MSMPLLADPPTRQFCHELGCPGNAGVDVHRVPDTERTQGWNEPEECPSCGNPLHRKPIDWQSALQEIPERLIGAGITIPEVPLQVDAWDLARAIATELERQRKHQTAFLERRHPPKYLPALEVAAL